MVTSPEPAEPELPEAEADQPEPVPDEPDGGFAELHDLGEGDGLVRANAWATAVFALVAALAAAFPDPLSPVFVPVSLVLFAAGCVAFVWGYARAIGRSRFEAVDLGGLFFLGGDVAPPRVRRALYALLAAQVVVAVAAAAVRPFTALAFGVLAPTLGLGVMALWAARHGTFPPKPAED
jgi:hypothetical protein